MASVHYAQFESASYTGQTAEDDLSWASAPAVLRAGNFRIFYIPHGDETTITRNVLLNISSADPDDASFEIRRDAGVTRAAVSIGGSVVAQSDPLTFAAWTELTLEFHGLTGTVVVGGADSGDSTNAFSPWSITDAGMRLGGVYGATGYSAKGLVSVPYPILTGVGSEASPYWFIGDPYFIGGAGLFIS